jgi:hypothetical protein
MDYNTVLQWLQQLMGNQQNINSGQFNQGIGLQGQQLAQQGTQFTQGLGEQGREYDLSHQLANAGLTEQGRQFDVSTALQKVIADWQNQLANKQFGLQQGAQQFGQNFATRQFEQMSPAKAQEMQLASLFSPESIKSRTDYANELRNRYDPYSPQYMGGVPAGDGFNYNPYTNKMVNQSEILLAKY